MFDFNTLLERGIVVATQIDFEIIVTVTEINIHIVQSIILVAKMYSV